MVDATRSSAPGRGLGRLRRRSATLSMLLASMAARWGEAQALREPALPAAAGPKRRRRARSRSRAREIVASTISALGGERGAPEDVDRAVASAIGPVG